MTDHRLAPLLAPRTIAFVGASGRRDTPGNDMLRTVRRGGFAGRAWGINPGYTEVEGFPFVPSLADLPEPPDLAVLSVRNERLEETLAAAIAAGARAAVIFASGYLVGDRDPPLAARLAAMAREAGMPICGGNCMGFYNDLDGTWICGFPSPRQRRPGSIALIAHSGSVFGALAHNDQRLQYALAVSPGQELVTGIADYMDYALDRPEVKVVGLFMETARDPAAFAAALAKAAERRVPVVVLKAGRTDAAAAAALTHTGALAGNDAGYQALFDRHGAIRVETLDELAASLMLFSNGRRAAPGRLVSIHDSGGERELIIDLADRVGVEFAPIGPDTRAAIAARLDPGLEAANPLDAWGTGADFARQFEACLDALLADPAAGLGVFCADIRDNYYLSEGFATAAIGAAAKTDKPVAFVTNYTQVNHRDLSLRLAEAGVPVLDGTVNALTAVRGAFAYRDFLARPADPAPELPGSPDERRAAARARLARGMDESGALALLAAYGIPVAEHAVVETEAHAVAAATRIGFPVVLKTAVPGILHKSDAGGVKLGLADAEAVRAAWADLAGRLGARATVARMIPPGVEISLGFVRDPQFGPLVSVGAGGVLIELLGDRRAALAPFGPATARRLLDGLALRRLLDGYRGAPAVDIDELAGIVARFSVLAADLDGLVAEMDVNPLVCGRDIVAVDALAVPSRGEA